MSFLEGLGHVAGGLAQGLQRGQQIRGTNMALEQQQKQMDSQAAIEADMRAADEAAAAAVKNMQAQHQQQYTGMGAFMARGGSDGSLAGGDAAQDAVSQPVPAFQPSKRQMLAVSEARTNELLKRGRTDQAMKMWIQDEGMRFQLRQEEAQKGLARFKATGDPTELLKGVYENVDDGFDISNVIQGPETQDGVKIFGVERVNQATGKKEVHELRSDEIEDLVMQSLDPKGSAEYAWRSKLEAFKGKQARNTNDARHKQTLAEIDRRGTNSLSLQDSKNEGAQTVAETRAEAGRDAAQIRAKASITIAELRNMVASGGKGGRGSSAKDGIQSHIKNADGTVTVVMRQLGEDGQPRAFTLKAPNGEPLRHAEAEKQLIQITGAIGKTMAGSLASYGDNRALGATLQPKPPAARPDMNQFVRQPGGQAPQPGKTPPPIEAFLLK